MREGEELVIMIAYLTLSDSRLMCGQWDFERQAWLFYIVEDKKFGSGARLSWNKLIRLGDFSPVLPNMDILFHFFPQNQRLGHHKIDFALQFQLVFTDS